MTVPSYELINYAVRTGKTIERKMIAEALLRIERVRPLADYRYIGFGGIFFTDFLVMHRVLGISSMISIEEQVDRLDRIEFNRPLGCITLKPGQSNAVLGTLDWSMPTILWLDYDQPISSDILADIEYVASQLASGSVLLVSLNVHPPAIAETGSRVAWLRERLGATRMPADVTADAHLNRKRLPGVSRNLLAGAWNKSLSDRNRALPPSERLAVHQLFNFQYADGALMATVGGFMSTDAERASFMSSLQDLPQINTEPEPHKLHVPVLTPRERFHLGRQLPCPEAELTSPGVSAEDLSAFARLHRHYPNYLDVPL